MQASPHYIGADGVGREAIANAGSKPLLRPEPLERISSLAYVIFERPDLEKQKAFLEDFGMQPAASTQDALYFRGHGTSPWFYCATRGPKARYIGAGYNVSSSGQLERIASRHGVEVEEIDAPGGGSRVRLLDPDGFVADFVHGRQESERLPGRDMLFPVNTPASKSRVNQGVRSSAEPSALEKLGHLVLGVTDFQRSAHWYMENLGVIPTDVQCVADGTPVLAFMRCDLGDTPADHHTVVLVQNVEPVLMHTAYETLDLDAIGQGAQFLHWKGWKHFWGIGRHILGSQIFDYWLDPYGAELEHYADGDVFTASHPTAYHPLDRGSLWTWGHDQPPMHAPGPLTLLKLMLSSKSRKMFPILGSMRAALALKARPWLK